MKQHLLVLIGLLVAFNLSAQTDFFDLTNSFMATYVKDGLVDYRALDADPSDLNACLDAAKTVQLDRAQEAVQVAFYINLYNLFVIDQLVDNYPVRSPKDLAGFFDAKRFNVGGKRVSLNGLEHTILAGVRKDPRFHFVLVCGAKGCPKLDNRAVTAEGLEDYLDARTRNAFDDPSFIRDGEKIGLSQIFNWYAKDFGEAVEYINRYRNSPLDAGKKTYFYEYDWSVNGQGIAPIPKALEDIPLQGSKSNVQTYTPSVLLKKGQTDVTIFNSIYTQTKSNWMGQDFSGTRETFAGSWVQITRGVSKNARINVGLDINIKASGRAPGDSSFAAIGEAFAFSNDANHRFGVTTIGPKIKIAPFEGVGNFSIESILWIPVGSFLEGRNADAGGELYFLDWERLIWWNRFYYDKVFGDFQVFTEIDLLFRLPIYKEQRQALDMPVNLIFSWFPTSKSTLYVLGQHVNRYQFDTMPNEAPQDGITTAANYTTWGLGGKYQLTDRLNLEALYTNFWRGVNSGLGETYNLGLKYIF